MDEAPGKRGSERSVSRVPPLARRPAVCVGCRLTSWSTSSTSSATRGARPASPAAAAANRPWPERPEQPVRCACGSVLHAPPSLGPAALLETPPAGPLRATPAEELRGGSWARCCRSPATERCRNSMQFTSRMWVSGCFSCHAFAASRMEHVLPVPGPPLTYRQPPRVPGSPKQASKKRSSSAHSCSRPRRGYSTAAGRVDELPAEQLEPSPAMDNGAGSEAGTAWGEATLRRRCVGGREDARLAAGDRLRSPAKFL
mmetsp:Transcript_81896/g.227027  ORF Transcript_81896/g.227027 Transcript_81896/m.227027 type:complete len:257 (+) Transcript_81896:918-1688(+)